MRLLQGIPIITLLVTLCCSCALTAKPSDTSLTQVIYDQLSYIGCNRHHMSTSDFEIHEAQNSSGIWYHILTRSRDFSPAASSLLIIFKTPPHECGASFNASYSLENSEARIEGSWLDSSSDSPSLFLRILTKTLERAYQFALDWDEEYLTLRSPSLEMGYLKRPSKQVPHPSSSATASYQYVNNWQFWLKENVSEDETKDFSQGFKGLQINSTLYRRPEKKDTNITQFRCTLKSQEKKYHILNISRTFHLEESDSQVQQIQLQLLPLNMILKFEETSKKRSDHADEVNAVVSLTNEISKSTLSFTKTEVTRHAINREKSNTCNDPLKKNNTQSKGKRVAKSYCDCKGENNSICQDSENRRCRNPHINDILGNDERCHINHDFDSSKKRFTSSNRLRELSQIFMKKNYFKMESNMTIDVTSDGHQIIWIFQHMDLDICPALGWSLKQIFNFSSNFSGWEYVVSEWEWGNMVVKGEWGNSFLQYYQKTFAFSFDQDIPLPSTQIILDFRAYTSFVVKITCPTLASSIITKADIMYPRFTFSAVEQNEFVGEGGKTNLISLEGLFEDGLLVLSWSVMMERLTEISHAISDVLSQVISHPNFCGCDEKDWSLGTLFMHLLGFDEDSSRPDGVFWREIQHQLVEIQETLAPISEMPELQDLWKTTQEYFRYDGKTDDFGVWQKVWRLVKRFHIAEEKPGGRGLIIHVHTLNKWINIAERFWNTEEDERDSRHCKIPFHLLALLKDIQTL